MRVPEGYDGIVVGTASDATDITGENIIWDIDFTIPGVTALKTVIFCRHTKWREWEGQFPVMCCMWEH